MSPKKTAQENPLPSNVRIVAGAGHAAIQVDGADVGGHVAGYSLTHDIREALPHLVLHVHAPDGAEWEGMARVAVADPQPSGDVIAAFLSGIDPDALYEAVLERDDLDGSSNEITKAILAQLADWAQGKT